MCMIYDDIAASMQFGPPDRRNLGGKTWYDWLVPSNNGPLLGLRWLPESKTIYLLRSPGSRNEKILFVLDAQDPQTQISTAYQMLVTAPSCPNCRARMAPHEYSTGKRVWQCSRVHCSGIRKGNELPHEKI